MIALRRMDVPRVDPTAREALRRLDATLRQVPRIPTLKRRARRDPLMATVEECMAAKARR